MVLTPAFAISLARTVTSTSPDTPQPSTATMPSLASIPTTTRSPYFWQASFTRAGFLTATEPRITRCTPRESTSSMFSMVRMPPPSSTGILTVSTILFTTSRLTDLPARAPSKSTRCRNFPPLASHLAAISSGLSLNTVSWAKSPLNRRTHLPPRISIAGKITIFRSYQ